MDPIENTKNFRRRDRISNRPQRGDKPKSSDDICPPLSSVGRPNTSGSYRREGTLAQDLLKVRRAAETLAVAIGYPINRSEVTSQSRARISAPLFPPSDGAIPLGVTGGRGHWRGIY